MNAAAVPRPRHRAVILSAVDSFSVGGFVWQPTHGGRAFVVIVKATFDLVPRELRLASEPLPLYRNQQHRQDDRRGNVYAPSDMAPFKEQVDVMVVGVSPQSGHAAGPTRLIAGNLHKCLPRDLCKPSEWGPVGPMDPSRRLLLGSDAARFQDDSWRDQPLPNDVDSNYFNAAPSDQRLPLLPDDAPLCLEGMHPHSEVFISRLPGIRPRAFWRPVQAAPEKEMSLMCDTLWVDLKRRVCTVTWRGSVSLVSGSGRIVVASQNRNQALTWPSNDRRAFSSSGVRRAVRAGGQAAPPPDREPLETLGFSPPGPLSLSPLPFVPLPANQHQVLSHRIPASPKTPAERQGAAVSLAAPPPAPQPWPPMASTPPTSHTLRPPSQAQPSSSPWASASLHAVTLPSPPRVDSATSVVPPAMLHVDPHGPMKVYHVEQGPLVNHRIELIGHDTACRSQLQHALLDGESEEPPNPSQQLRNAFGERSAPERAVSAREMVRVMTHNRSAALAQHRRALREAVDEDGVFTAPTTVVSAELEFRYEPFAMLEATVAIALPAPENEEELQAALTTARALIESPRHQRCADAASHARQRLLALLDDTAPERVEQLLVARRAFCRTKVFGVDHVVVTLRHDNHSWPCYLPPEYVTAAPTFAHFPCRVVAEIHPRQNQSEFAEIALRALALGRIVAR